MTAAEQAHNKSCSPALALQTIAHELRQPLGAMESIAYYLAMVLPKSDRRALEQVSRLQHLVEQSNWILTAGLQLVDDTPLAPEPLDLAELITQTVAKAASHPAPDFHLDLAADLPLVHLDPGRGRLLIENLLLLFQQFSNSTHPACLTTSRTEAGVCLAIATAAPGHRSESSLGPGCSLSLASARRVVEAHHGTFDLEVCPTRGITARVVLPDVVEPNVVLP